MVLWFGTALVLVGLSVLVVSFNRFVRQRQLIDNSWSNVDTELKRRYDLVPNLVETVRGYATHERATLDDVITARGTAVAAAGSPVEQAGAENLLVGALRHLMALSEAYPDLKANEGFLDLQAELVRTEDRIQLARRLYNGNVRDFNTRVQSIPSNVVARLGGFRPADFFEIDALEGRVPTVRLTDGDGPGST